MIPGGLVLLSALALSKDLLDDLRTQQVSKTDISLPIKPTDVADDYDFWVMESDEGDCSSLLKKLDDILKGVDFSVEPFFENEQEEVLSRYFQVTVPHVRFKELRAGPFEHAYRLQSELDLLSCEPFFSDQDDDDDDDDDDNAPPVQSEDFTSFPGPSGRLPEDYEWHLKNARVPDAWKYSEENKRPVAGKGVIIAQIDTGKADHTVVPFDGDVWHPLGENFVNPRQTKSPVDPFGYNGNPGHGHRVASLAAGNGQIGGRMLRGSAHAAQVMPMRAIKSVFASPKAFAGIAKAVNKAVQQNATVISMSLGNVDNFGIVPQVVRDALLKAADRNVILVAAAGQVGLGVNVGVAYPARDPNVIAIAGSTADDTPWVNSFNGEQVVVSAPSEGIVVPDRDSNTGNTTSVGIGDGTSFATALAGGIAAMWLAHHGRENLIASLGEGERLQEVFEACCKETARKPSKPQPWPRDYGAGIINAEAILKQDVNSLRLGENLFSSSVKRFARPRHSIKLANAQLVETAKLSPEIVGKLSLKDLDRFASELVWLGPDYYPTAQTGKTMSPLLREIAGV